MLQSNLATRDALYRLALLTYGDVDLAEARTWDLVRDAPAGGSVTELIPALPLTRVRRWRYAPPPRLAVRTGLRQDEVQSLLDALASLAPEQRLALGLSALRSLPWSEAAALVAKGRRPADPRPQLGAILGLIPLAEAGLPIACHRCLEAIQRDEEGIGPAMRQHLAGCDHCQSVRAGWQMLNDRLRTALPALFVTPPDVLRRFAGPPPDRTTSGHWRIAGLLGVFVLLLAFFVLRSGNGDQELAAMERPESLTAQEVITRTIERFERAPAGGGVVHEVIDFQLSNQSWASDGQEQPEYVTLERWYDYGPPARVRVELRRGDSRFYAIAINGKGQIQSEWTEGGSPPQRATVTMEPELEARYLPLLRQPFANGIIPGLYAFHSDYPFSALQVARSNPGAVLPLGSTTALGRPAWLISIAGEQEDYLLTIDQETYAIADIQLVERGRQQEGLHPWRARLLEVLDEVPDERFVLGSASWGETIKGPVPPLFWVSSFSMETSIVEPPTDIETMLLPDSQVITASLTTIFWGEDDIRETVFAYWDEYGLVVFSHGPVFHGDMEFPEEEAGLRFQIETEPSDRLLPGSLVTVDISPLMPSGQPSMLLIHMYLPLSPPDEREALARAIIGTLAPADEQGLADFLNFGEIR